MSSDKMEQDCDEDNDSIDNNKDIEMLYRPKNVVEDNFSRYYAVNEINHFDNYVDKHYNDMYMIGIAPSHPIRIRKLPIKGISFEIGKRTIKSFEVSGKKKTGAIKLQNNTKLCHIFIDWANCKKEENDPEFYVFSPMITGKVIEINKRLIDNPSLIIDNGDIEGWIAIVEDMNYNRDARKNNNMRKKKTKNVLETLLNKDQYLEYLKKHNINVPLFG